MASIAKITHDDVKDFTKFLIEAGNVYAVDENLWITTKLSNEKVKIKDKGDKELPIKIYHTNRENGEYHVLNPFKETTASNKAADWFYHTIEMRMAYTLSSILKEIIELSISKEDAAQAKMVQLLTVIDVSRLIAEESMIEQLDMIQPKELISVFYHSRQKQGQVQSDINDPDVIAKYKKIKKKTWTFISDAFWSIFGCAPSEIHKLLSYTATTIPAPHSETLITLMFRYFKILEPICKILDISCPDIEQFSSHLVYIEKYQRLVTFDDTLVNRPVKEITPPWGREVNPPVQAGPVQGNISGPVNSGPLFSKGVPQVVMTGHGIQNIDGTIGASNPTMSIPNTGQKFGSTGFVQSGPMGFGTRPQFINNGPMYNRGFGSMGIQQNPMFNQTYLKNRDGIL